MYNLKGLIPSRFLCLIAHLIITVSLIWESQKKMIVCSTANEELSQSHHTQLLVGLCITLGLIAFELIAFLSGATMFHSSSDLLSILCHSCATIVLTYFITDSWQCGWFWIIFSLCSVLPAFFDFCVVLSVKISGQW